MKPVDEVSFFAWLAWNEDEDMWGLVAVEVPTLGVAAAAGVRETTARRLKPMVGLVARTTEKQIKLVKFTFAEVLDEVG